MRLGGFDEHGDGLTIERLHAHQFVGIAPTMRAVGADLLEFIVEILRRHTPVDPGVDGREQQREELGEEAFQRLFPRAVVVAFGRLGGRVGDIGGHAASVADWRVWLGVGEPRAMRTGARTVDPSAKNPAPDGSGRGWNDGWTLRSFSAWAWRERRPLGQARKSIRTCPLFSSRPRAPSAVPAVRLDAGAAGQRFVARGVGGQMSGKAAVEPALMGAPADAQQRAVDMYRPVAGEGGQCGGVGLTACAPGRTVADDVQCRQRRFLRQAGRGAG